MTNNPTGHDDEQRPSGTLRIILVDEPPSWTRRIILIGVVSGVLAALAYLAWPTIAKPLGLTAGIPSRFLVAMIVAPTFGITCSLVYFVAKKSLWDFLDLLIVPLALAIIGFGFAVHQQTRQTQLEQQRDERAQAVEAQRAQNEALQAYLGQMSHLMLEKGLPDAAEGDTVFTLAQAQTTTAISQLDWKQNQAVTRFLSDSGLLKDPALLANADLSGAVLQNADLTDAVLTNTNLTDAYLAGTKLNRSNLTDAVLNSAVFSATEKEGEDTIPITADLTRANLTKATLLEADLAYCTLDKVTLTKAALQGANLSGASLQDANLTKAALLEADLSGAGLQDLNLQHAPLRLLKERSTDLTHANLSHAALLDADLSGAVLQNANLTDAVLTDADLTDAYLSGAILTDAVLTDAVLTDARGWTMEQLRAASSLEGATMPDGQTLKSDKMPHRPTFEEWLKDKEGRKENAQDG
jgi:uncharacterized protein YjbI with pentapeptide repeats